MSTFNEDRKHLLHAHDFPQARLLVTCKNIEVEWPHDIDGHVVGVVRESADEE